MKWSRWGFLRWISVQNYTEYLEMSNILKVWRIPLSGLTPPFRLDVGRRYLLYTPSPAGCLTLAVLLCSASYCTRGEECRHGVNEWLLLLACWSALFHHNLIVGRLENVAELCLANRDDLTEYKYLRWLPVTKRHPLLFCTLSVAVFWKQQPAAITGTGVC